MDMKPEFFNVVENITSDNIQEILQYVRLNVTEKYPFPPQIVKVKGTTIATVGNFSASTGKPKSKKTFNVSAIVASALSGKEVLCYTTCLPAEKKRILYVDTEQSRPHCHKVLQRILRLAGLPVDSECEDIDFLVLREFSPLQRRTIIDCTLAKRSDYGLVVIDGIRDLLRDINSPSESLDVINDLMRWSSFYNLHIHTVLHLNKADDNTRGHIGTELNNKAETILQITKKIDNEKMSEVKAMHIRDQEFTPFAFEIGDDSLPHLVENYQAQKSASKYLSYKQLSDEQHREALEAAFKDASQMSYAQLVEAVRKGYESIGYQRGRNTIINIIKFLQYCGAIVKTDRDYSYNPDFHIKENSGLV